MVIIVIILSKKLDEEKLKPKLIDFIRYHSLLLSFMIILIGFFVIFYSINDPKRSNIIIIDTHSALTASLNDWKFNASESDILPIIEINIDYKEPVKRYDHLYFDTICLLTPRYVDEYITINKISLSISGYDSVFFPKEGFMQLDSNFQYFPNKKEWSGIDYGYQGWNYDKINCKQYDNNSYLFIEPNSNNKYEFSYKLHYTDIKENRFELMGKANLKYPILNIDPIDETNIRVNKSILFLTGCLIILGSFSFITSLKQLLKEE